MQLKTLCVTLTVASLCAASFPTPAASTREEVQALRAEIAELKAGQVKMQSELAEIRKLLEAGNRPSAAPAAQAFQPREYELGEAPPMLGDASAAVTVVEFSDYQCPFCKRHANTVLPELVKQYGDTGKARFVMREFPIENIHPHAFAASQAALCAAEQGQYWAMHDQLFEDQRALADVDLKAHAVTIGLDATAFNACLDGERHSDRIRQHQQDAASMGISGTPSFVLGLTDRDNPGKVHLSKIIRGAQPLPAFQAAIDELLEQADED